MKKIFTILVALFITTTIWAQAPQKMSYQAVIRNSSDALITNTQIGMQISILQGSSNWYGCIFRNPNTNNQCKWLSNY